MGVAIIGKYLIYLILVVAYVGLAILTGKCMRGRETPEMESRAAEAEAREDHSQVA